ncbi:uncharacterized protein CTRU02_201523 [Colletotrichum truncatum]|uniref:Uncharacterized protein n=1 Tax=Colletotrichum truncatum TaxID=5467 RepID=A0ACC3ZHQ7_COLTU
MPALKTNSKKLSTLNGLESVGAFWNQWSGVNFHEWHVGEKGSRQADLWPALSGTAYADFKSEPAYVHSLGGQRALYSTIP